MSYTIRRATQTYTYDVIALTAREMDLLRGGLDAIEHASIWKDRTADIAALRERLEKPQDAA